jgi:hypothetical protein
MTIDFKGRRCAAETEDAWSSTSPERHISAGKARLAGRRGWKARDAGIHPERL